MTKTLVFLLGVVGIGAVTASATVFGVRAPADHAPIQPVFTEAKWPFAIDQWGTGKAFVCQPADCGSRIDLYVRPKIGYCNCSTGVSDDAELERVSDNDLVAPRTPPRGAGRPIKVGWMAGRSRAYAVSEEATGQSVLSVAFNDECDVVVALVRLGNADPATIEPAVMAFLNSKPMVLWAKKELGLEFIRRDW